MVKKMRSFDEYVHHFYVHMDEIGKFVIFSELSIQQFITSLQQDNHLLLLKSPFEGPAYNGHTYFDYVPKSEIRSFQKQVAEQKEDICFIDFQLERSLDLLTAKEQSELLYLAHKREPIISPFFYKLNNRFVVYASPSERITKVFFRSLDDTELLVSAIFNQHIAEREGTNSFWRRKLKNPTPAITPETLRDYRSYSKEGVLLSLAKQPNAKSTYAIELRTLGDNYDYPDEIWFDLREILRQTAEETLIVSS